MVKPFLKALAGEAVRPAPFWLMRQAGRYLPEYRKLRASTDSFLDLCFSPALAAEITLQPVRRFEPDAAILFSDILTIPHAMGQEVRFLEGKGPVLGPFDPASLQPVGGRLDSVYEAVRLVRRSLTDEVALIGFAGAPWTVAAYMIEGGSSRDWLKVRQMALGEPDGFGALIDRLIEATIDYLAAQVEAGAEALQLFDSWAGLLPPSGIRRWCLEPARRITAGLKQRHPFVPLILFPRGAGALAAEFAEIGDCVGIDTTADPAWAAGAIQDKAAVQGNLDPMLLVIGGTTMEQAAREILFTLRQGPHIFNLGHGVLPATPPEHVAALRRLVREVL
ncbi:MAG: uroporphyrinogen decarboxylase [Alphaproteobacteria bacterium]|nr:uroporphyrinogen decarboxylase [Alphaproteobacteria bacterium]MCY4317927.1 uroporphyrinogen decarboxylase [Alphaproteobacteria bacterium]